MALRDRGQQPHQRREDPAQEVDRAGEQERHPLRVGESQRLGHELAEDDREQATRAHVMISSAISSACRPATGGARTQSARPPTMLAPANVAARKPTKVSPIWIVARKRAGCDTSF